MSRIFRKTPSGVEAFTNAASGLSHPHRALLVLIDGKRSASLLRKFGASFGDVNVILNELYAAGLVELDPAYIAKVRALQLEATAAASDNGTFTSSLAAQTIIAGSHTRAGPATIAPSITATPTANGDPPSRLGPSTQLRPVKRDLRELAMLGEPDPVPTSAPASNPVTRSGAPVTRTGNTVMGGSGLSLEPLPEGAGLTIPSVSKEALEQAKKFAKSYLFNTLGSSGTPLCFAIEKADSLKRLLEVTDIAAKTLRDMKNKATSDDFQRQLNETLVG